ncbi:uncharacterized protein LOC121385043 [Gigantopelta aegis]|uniref:uncharacterized protein LOC121385043 n=1 Tax=Gigantopelta aegis TaxID=1735272 RepID=UPI001B888DFE|nr:uncharacterized protein LOC121385043 [Gigantopelta aegis]
MTTYGDFLVRRLWEEHKSPRNQRFGYLDSLTSRASVRDFRHRQVLVNPSSYSQDFRYRGYPGNSFLKPRLHPGQQVIEAQTNSSNSRKPPLFNPAEFQGRRSVANDFHDHQVNPPESYPVPQYRQDMEKPQTPSTVYVHQTRGMPLGERRTTTNEVELAKGDGDNRKRKFTEQDVTPRGELKYRDPMLPVRLLSASKWEKNKDGNFILDHLGRPGNGAPLVTETGEIKADLQGDPSIRYNEGGRASIENRLRYRPVPPQIKTSVQSQNEQKQLEIQTARIKELRQELDMIRKSEDFGKQGGGASHNPQPQSDSFAARTEDSKSLDLERTRGGAGAPQLDDTGRPKTKFPITMHRNDYGANLTPLEVSHIDEVLPSHRRRMKADKEDEDYYPFGRPGAGAPVLDSQGKPRASLNGSLTKQKTSADIRRKQLAARELLKELNQEMVEQKKNKEDMNNYMKQPDKDLAELITQGRVGYPRRDPETGALLPQHLASSDVSKQMTSKVDQTKMAQKKYHDELEIQANERKRMRELEKLKQKQEEVLHCDVFGGQFRRYGGGAPKGPYTQKKENLSQMLYSPRKEDRVVAKPPWDSSENQQYRKVYEEDRLYPVGHYAKSTIRSTHANQFEIPAQTTKGNYHPPAPYATI